jgi:hypothetical protein
MPMQQIKAVMSVAGENRMNLLSIYYENWFSISL